MNQYDDEIEGALSGWSAPRPLTVDSLTADAAVYGREARVCGWSLRAVTAGGAVIARLWDGGSTGGQLLGVVALAAGASDTQWLGDDGVRANAGLFVEIDSGTLEGVLYVRYPLI